MLQRPHRKSAPGDAIFSLRLVPHPRLGRTSARRPLPLALTTRSPRLRWFVLATRPQIGLPVSEAATLSIRARPLGMPHTQRFFEAKVRRPELLLPVRKIAVRIVAPAFGECVAEAGLFEVGSVPDFRLVVCEGAIRPVLAFPIQEEFAHLRFLHLRAQR